MSGSSARAPWLVPIGLVSIACLAACGEAPAATSTSSTSAASGGGGSVTSSATGSASSGNGAGGSGGAASGCPAGQDPIASLPACAAAAPPPPAALATAASSGVRGDEIDLAGLSVASAPCAAVLVCRPKDAPTLLFSDEPETTSTDGIVYADTIAPGRYRAYVYHVNASSAPRKFPIVVLNQGADAATITITKKGLAGPTTDYPAAGKQAVIAWLGTSAPTTRTVPAGQRVLFDGDLDALHAGKDELVHAIIDFETDRTVKVSVVSVPASADAATVTASLSVVPSTGQHARGTFPGAAFTLIGDGAALDGVRSISLGSGTVDADLAGHSAVDGGAAVTLKGNFGVPWQLSLPTASKVALALSPRGGAWGGGALLGAGADGVVGVVPLPSSATTLDTGARAIHLGRFQGGDVASGTLMTGGGSSLPLTMLLVPL